MHASVLIIEDHRDLAETLLDYLEQQGWRCDYAPDGVTGLHLAATQAFDAIVLDLALPVIDGITLCRRLRQDARRATPVLMLTARDALADKLDGFEAGADDYVVKPVALPELAARLQALVRRSRGAVSDSRLRVADLELDTSTLEVWRAGEAVPLSPTCRRILRILMRQSPQVVSREALESELWGDLVPDSDALRSHLYKLRKAIDKPFQTPLLHTIPGLGFKLAAD